MAKVARGRQAASATSALCRPWPSAGNGAIPGALGFQGARPPGLAVRRSRPRRRWPKATEQP